MINPILATVALFAAILLLAGSTFGAEPPILDLGVVSDRTYIALDACTNRADFVRFEIEVLAVGTTNQYDFSTTNRYLQIRELTNVPDGKVILGIRSICEDQDESEMKLARMDIRRHPPSAPGVRKIKKLTPAKPKPDYSKQLLEARRKAFSLNEAPAPAGAVLVNKPFPTNLALPNSNNLSYNEFLARERTGRRRSE